MRWYASIYTVEPVGDDGDTQRVLQLSFIFEAGGDSEDARKQVTDVMPAVVAMLDLGNDVPYGEGPVLGDGLCLEVRPLARHVSECENRFKDLKEKAAAMSEGEDEKEYDGL